jgi:hypothetical protein
LIQRRLGQRPDGRGRLLQRRRRQLRPFYQAVFQRLSKLTALVLRLVQPLLIFIGIQGNFGKQIKKIHPSQTSFLSLS